MLRRKNLTNHIKSSINKSLNRCKKRDSLRKLTTGNAVDLANYRQARDNATREIQKSKRLRK